MAVKKVSDELTFKFSLIGRRHSVCLLSNMLKYDTDVAIRKMRIDKLSRNR